MKGYEVDMELADGSSVTETVQAQGAFTAVAVAAQRVSETGVRSVRGVRRRFLTGDGSYPVTTIRKRD